MKTLITLLLVMTSSTYAAEIIANNDVIKSNRVSLYLDGVELWDVPEEYREDLTAEFTNKCLTEIPTRVLGHEPVLADFYPNFTHNLRTRVERVTYRGKGVQLLCRANMKLNRDYKFSAVYSTIYNDNVNGTFNFCKNLIEELDNSPSEEPVLMRRAYYTYAQRENGEAYFPQCQILKLLVLPRD